MNSFWLDVEEGEPTAPLVGRARADVAVIGAGITGLTTALLLQRAGASVALVDRHRIASRTTGHTTAKVTVLHGLMYAQLVEQRGEEPATEYLTANLRAMALVSELAAEIPDGGELMRLPAYTYTQQTDRVTDVQAEAETLVRLGQPATVTSDTGLPYPIAAAVQLDDQLAIHPVRYCLGLRQAFVAAGGAIYEHTNAVDVEDGAPCLVRTEHGELEADWVVVATLIPFLNDGWYAAKAEPSRSYAVLAHVGDEPADIGGMYLSADQPTRTLRPTPVDSGMALVLGGEGHRTGEENDTRLRYEAIERWASEHFPVQRVSHRWSAQDFVPVDGLPFVGRLGSRDRVLVATGFKKWGLSNGTAAALALHGLVTSNPPDWAGVYDSTRSVTVKGPREFAKHNFKAAKHLIGDRLRSRPDIEALSPGAGAIVDADGEKAAVYRDNRGGLHAVSPVCTHLGCLVQWNTAERSWDCPCHGSRFTSDGAVLDGPAVAPLESIDLTESAASEDA
ncbi:MAG: FAD-dependent oxidoreductase [Actinobacteria bacterium]|nr:FAD-dependent oxidoreductase [Actinomycetota bacterium]